jgi:hypothetical protein
MFFSRKGAKAQSNELSLKEHKGHQEKYIVSIQELGLFLRVLCVLCG